MFFETAKKASKGEEIKVIPYLSLVGDAVEVLHEGARPHSLTPMDLLHLEVALCSNTRNMETGKLFSLQPLGPKA